MSDADRLAYWKRRARDAEWRITALEREIANMQRWGERAYVESRFFARRCEFLATLAVNRGATLDDLDNGAEAGEPMTRAVPTPPPWHPRLVAATWAGVVTFCAACWWLLIRETRRWQRGHR